MKLLKHSILILLIISICLNSCDNLRLSSDKDQNIVIMLSLDGFRWDYPELYHTPNFDFIASHGVKAESIIPCFPSKTFPNHYSMATGLYPDNHGLVNNTFYDPGRQEIYSIGDRSKVEDGYYYGGEPIWVTAEKQGIKTASFFWVGSEAEINGYRPGIWKVFNSSIPYGDRMDSVISWTQLPKEERPGLITWYIEEPDGVGHNFGPQSSETEDMVEHLDSLVGVFIKRIHELPNFKNIDIIITSDHGMGETHGEKYINILENIPENWILRVLGYNPVLFIDPNEGYADSVWAVLNNTTDISVWDKENVPDYLHYRDNPRISKFIIAADSGFSIGTKAITSTSVGGAHGYDPGNSDMHAIFYAIGPNFKKNYKQESFKNIDLYPLICELLDIVPEAVDGSLSRVSGMIDP
ncbi:MAG: ectonucleotide pyrophosphatase/phosphodiesterase [Bacteroidales bacterium]|nr:ectonucleotide pyrophosphatase/phosphodiesterase [Bacteroidales bacterium]